MRPTHGVGVPAKALGGDGEARSPCQHLLRQRRLPPHTRCRGQRVVYASRRRHPMRVRTSQSESQMNHISIQNRVVWPARRSGHEKPSSTTSAAKPPSPQRRSATQRISAARLATDARPALRHCARPLLRPPSRPLRHSSIAVDQQRPRCSLPPPLPDSANNAIGVCCVHARRERRAPRPAAARTAGARAWPR